MQLLREAEKIWHQIARNRPLQAGETALPHAVEKLINLISVGDFYYYIFNLSTAELEYISPEVEKVLGHKLSLYNTSFLIQSIHPEDVSWFLDFEASAVDFLKSLPVEKLMKYKMRYDYRIRRSDGEYIRVLHQAVAIEHNEFGDIFRTFGVHTDITSIKKDGKPVMSYIGLDGEPSFIDVKPKKGFAPSTELFSKREKEILYMLAKGNSSMQIGKKLNISKHTVDTHRRNMLQKTNCTNVAELINHSLLMGYL